MAPDRPDAVDQLFGGLGGADRQAGGLRREAPRREDPPEGREPQADPKRGRGRPKGKASSMLHLYVSEELRIRLDAAAAVTGRSRSKLVEEWVSPHLEEYADVAEMMARMKEKKEEAAGGAR